MNALDELKKKIQELETNVVVIDHRHCKDCGDVIMKWKSAGFPGYFANIANIIKTRYYKLGICESCIIEKGVKEVKKRRKKK